MTAREGAGPYYGKMSTPYEITGNDKEPFEMVNHLPITEHLIDELLTLSRSFEEAKRELEEFRSRALAETPRQPDINEHFEIKQLNTKLQQATMTIDKEKKRVQSYALKLDQLNKEHGQCQEIIREYKSKISETDSTLERYKQLKSKQQSEVEIFQKEKMALGRQLQETKIELEDTKTRLSRMMGNKLSDNNPNITDLSDKNRPSKLGEKFQELYDNQWTDAFEVAELSYKTETDCVAVLLKILLAAKTFCEEESEKQEQTIKKSLWGSYSRQPLPDVANKLLKDLRKAMATENVDSVYQKFINITPTSSNRGILTHAVKEYVHECVTICWFMTLQDPPVVFGPNVNSREKFDTNVYRHYTISGELIDFVVWPSIYLHEGGPLLAKGVAQGCKERRPQSEKKTRDRHYNNQLGENYHGRPKSAPQPTTQSRSYRNHHDDPTRNVNTGENVGSAASPSGSKNVASTLATTLQHEPRNNSRTNYKQTTVTAKMATPGTGPETAYYCKYREPSRDEMGKYQFYISKYGEESARRIMGDRFEICHNYLEAKREYY